MGRDRHCGTRARPALAWNAGRREKRFGDAGHVCEAPHELNDLRGCACLCVVGKEF